MAKVIVASDSRGRGLTLYISNTAAITDTVDISHIFIPGANIQKLQQAIAEEHQHSTAQHTSIIITAGICNLTAKKYHRDGGSEVI